MRSPSIKLFLCGDVMTGRGVDQILPYPCNPRLHEEYMASAEGYVRLAEEAHGEIPRSAPFPYIWGAALPEFERAKPDLRIINLETSITRSESYFPKGINYRMSPENAGCLTSAGVDCCVLANNHVLDWGREGLFDTLETLQRLRIKFAGAGRGLADAWAPATFEIPGRGRVLIFSCACVSSGAPMSWAAKSDVAGIALLTSFSERNVSRIVHSISRRVEPGDVVVLSVHCGPNWGYEVSDEDRNFAHRLIDDTPISVLHCHSSHHPKGIEVYRDRLILYGCGDFLNDYEGISGYEEYRGDLALMYFVEVEAGTGFLHALEMTPLQIRGFRLSRPTTADVGWLQHKLDHESRKLGARVSSSSGERLALSWRDQTV
ncbi:CapA family protein [Methylocystis sp. IM3]|uniref:CapA family protein n=1 Tax=unclassified Methylocystis TaxID=2625913 RepID=UPI003119A982